MRKIFGFIFLTMILSNGGHATEKKSELIPIVAPMGINISNATPQQEIFLKQAFGEKGFHTLSKGPYDKDSTMVLTTSQIGESSVGSIAGIIKSIRDGICKPLQKGDEFKFYIDWDASAKVWGIGVGGKSGIEVKIYCK